MAINFTAALGIHPAALKIRSQKAEIIANNLVNADTPRFQARDISFKEALQAVAPGGNTIGLLKTNASHINPAATIEDPKLKYRIPMQPSADGNTVSSEVEYSKFSENALRYQATLRFLSGSFKSLRLAIRGD